MILEASDDGFTEVFEHGAATWITNPSDSPSRPGGDRAYVFRAAVGVAQVFDIDGAGNVTNPGVGVSIGNGAPSFFGVDQIAVTADGRSVLVHDSIFVWIIDAGSNHFHRHHSARKRLSGR